MGKRDKERAREVGKEREATRHKHSVAWHSISIDIYTVSMGISTRSDSGRAPPNTADSDPARSTQTRESIVAFKLPSYSGGLSLPESRATSGRRNVRTATYVSRRARPGVCFSNRLRVFFSGGEKKKRNESGERKRALGPRTRAAPAERERVRGLTRSRTGHPVGSDVRSALTCWIRRECDAKVSRSGERSRPDSKPRERGEGVGMDGQTDGRMVG